MRKPFFFFLLIATLSVGSVESTAQQLEIQKARINSVLHRGSANANQEYECEVQCECGLPHNEQGTDSGTAQFELTTRWSSTALSGSGLVQGDPTILTWSIIPDGTDANSGGGFAPSDMISALDSAFNEANAGTADLTNRFWFSLIQQALERWGDLSGLVYVYEPNDDGAANFSSNGELGVRGDIRIGGFDIPGGAIGFNSFPNSGDMAIDTTVALLVNPNNNFRSFRNLIAHENGHGTGFSHVNSNNASFLMEPFLNSSIDGPQLDDVRAIQRGYGDVFEKENNFAGNDSLANAVDLGVVNDVQTISIGNDGASGTVVDINDVDFVSIDDDSDQDFFSFTITEPSFVDVVLRPVGATYNQSPESGDGDIPLDTSASSNLRLVLFDAAGSVIRFVGDGGLGEPESVTDEFLQPGEYIVRVNGGQNAMQLYTLDISAESGEEPDSLFVIDLESFSLFDDLANQGNGVLGGNPDVFSGNIFGVTPPGIFGTPLYVRERQNENQPAQEVRADINFDLSAITTPVESAMLQFTAYTLNDVSDFSIGRITTEGTEFDRVLVDVISEIETFSEDRDVEDYSIDVTTIVNTWINEPATNLGFRIQLDDNLNDGIGIFDGSAIEINDVFGGNLPTPTSYIPIQLAMELGFLLGDVNCDGVVNLLDVGPFVDAISSGIFNPKADINGDGTVDLLDVNPFVNILTGG